MSIRALRSQADVAHPSGYTAEPRMVVQYS